MVLLVAVAVTAILAWAVSRKNGRFATVGTPDRISVAEFGIDLGERATLVQFSSAFCASYAASTSCAHRRS